MPTTSPDSSAPAETAVAQAPPSQKINGRYRPVRKLGRGGMGAVFLVLDTYHGDRPVALKRVRGDRLDKKADAILRNEYMALAGLEHPGLAGVFDFGIDRESSDYFFTSEFVDGVNLLKACQGIDLARVASRDVFIDMLAQILRALEYTHSRGLVHGDLKPENIMVTGLGADGRPGESAPRVKLIDFGLTKREKEFGGKKVLGTTYYIAPETITGSQVDRRTDLYSLGIVIYQLVTGRVPFEGESNAVVLKKHVENSPIHPCEIKPSIPQALGEIIVNLMEKRPVDRFQSAFSVLEALKRSFGLQIPLETPETCASYVRSTEMVGRDLDLRRLYTAFCAACRVKQLEIEHDLNLPSPGVPERGHKQVGGSPDPFFLLRGETGIGKRRLALEFKKLVEAHGVQFVAIECSENDEANPHADFLSLMRDLLGLARVGVERPRVFLSVAALVKDIGPGSRLPADSEASFHELATYVLRSSSIQPLVLHFHDLQRGGKLVMAFLGAMVSSMAQDRSASSRLLISACAPDRIDCESTLLHELLLLPSIRDVLTEVCLERLDAEGVARLLSAMFAGNDFPPAFVSRVHEESDGNPGVVQEICELFLANGLIVRTLAGWTLAGDHEKQAFPGRVRRELKEKIERLPGPACKLAHAFACLGNSTPLDLAVRLAQIPREKVLDSMQVLHRRKILREDTTSRQINVYSFVHASARDLLTEIVGAEGMRALHDRAGAICEEYYTQHGKKSPERLAVHFLRAGNRTRGVQYGLEAAKAAAKLEPRQAIDFYREVLRVGAGDKALADLVHFEVARLRGLMGQHREAIRLLLPMLQTRRQDGRVPAPAQLRVELARILIRTGEFKQANEHLDKAFALETGQLISGWMVHVLLGYAELHHALGCHEESLRSCQRVHKLKNEIHDMRLLSRLYALLAENSFALGANNDALNHCEEAINLTDSRSDVELLESNLFFMGLLHKYKGKLTRALKELELCARLRKKRGAYAEKADTLQEIGRLEVLIERPRRAVARLSTALELHEAAGNPIGTAAVLNSLAEARRLLGEYEDAKKAVAEAMRRGKAIRNPALLSESYITCGNISLDYGDTENAERYFKETRSHFPECAARSTRLLQGEYRLAFERGKFGAALDIAAQGLDLATRGANRHDMAWFVAERALLCFKLGKIQDVRALLVTLVDMVRRGHLHSGESRIHVLRGLLLASESAWEGAGKSVVSALEIAKDNGAERDLIRLYFEQGGIYVQMKDHERALLAYEESLYLAKKLNLVYWKCCLQQAMGILELAVESGDHGRAEEYLRVAERYARHGSYTETLWQIHYQMGKVLQRKGRDQEALGRFDEAISARQEVLRDLPAPVRESYLTQSGASDLERTRSEIALTVGGGAARAADPEAGGQEHKARFPGTSSSLRRLCEEILNLPENLPWVWILGPQGSGKLEVGRVIHKKLAVSGGRIWVHAGAEFDDAAVEGFFKELAQAREEAAKNCPWWYPTVAKTPGVENGSSPAAHPAGDAEEERKSGPRPRFTLVLRGADKQPAGARALLLDRLHKEPFGDFGVIAEVDASLAQAAKVTAFGPAAAPVIEMERLMNRLENIEALAAHFLEAGRKQGEPAPVLTPAALAVLQAHGWPGKVEELHAFCGALVEAAPPGEQVGEDLARRVLASLPR